MFRNLLKKAFGLEEPSQPKVKRGGLFSTDWRPTATDTSLVRENLTKHHIQKTPDNWSAITPDGTAVAMDASSIQTTKAAFGMNVEGVPDAQLGWYYSFGFIGYQLMAIISQNWLIDKAITMPARDAVRTGFDISVTDGKEVPTEKLDLLKKIDKKMKLMDNCVELVSNSRRFGIRHALFVVDYPNPDVAYEMPFAIENVKPGKYRGIAQIDPYWISPELDASAAANPAAIDFYEPTWWRVNGKRIHKSHFVIMTGPEVADILKPTYFYGGMSVTQKIVERAYAAERTANEGPMLAMTKRTTIIHTDIEAALANQDEFDQKMLWWAQTRDNMGIKVAGTDEVLEQFDTSLADLDVTIMTQFQLVAAVAEVPATKLLGTTPKGFNPTGEYDESNYHEMLESIQTHDLTRLINRHHELAIKSEVSPDAPFATEVAWMPLDTPTAKERSEINLSKAQTGESLINSGAILPEDERNRIMSDPDSGYISLVEPEDADPLINGDPNEENVEEDPANPDADEEEQNVEA